MFSEMSFYFMAAIFINYAVIKYFHDNMLSEHEETRELLKLIISQVERRQDFIDPSDL